MARTQPASTLLLPLPRGTVLLPGVVQRIPASANRPDIPALLSSVYSRAASKTANGRVDTVPVACVPIASPNVGPYGQLLIKDVDQLGEAADAAQPDSKRPTKGDLFSCGVAAKITGVEGRSSAGEFSLLVEGQARVRIEKITQERLHFEARVTYHHDDSMFRILAHRILHGNDSPLTTLSSKCYRCSPRGPFPTPQDVVS